MGRQWLQKAISICIAYVPFSDLLENLDAAVRTVEERQHSFDLLLELLPGKTLALSQHGCEHELQPLVDGSGCDV